MPTIAITVHDCVLTGEKLEKADPYVQFTCGDKNKCKTTTIKNAGAKICWGQTVTMFWDGGDVEVVVKNDKMIHDSTMGQGHIAKAAFLDNKYDGEILLSTKKGVSSGVLRLTAVITW